MDISVIAGLLSSVKSATDIAKLIKDAGVTLEPAEAKMKLDDLMSALAEIKLQAAEVQQTILDRDAEIRKLRADFDLRANLVWRQPCYFLPNGKGVEEPFCQVCYDSDEKLVRLHEQGAGKFSCRVCKMAFNTPERAAEDAARFEASQQANRDVGLKGR